MDNRAVIERLKMALELISDPEHWTQGASGRDKFGNPTFTAHSRNAIAYCSAGALRRTNTIHSVGTLEAHNILNRVARQMGYKHITHLNDSGTHEDVILMFKTAIAELEESNDCNTQNL